MNQLEIPKVKKMFQWAIERKMLRFSVEKGMGGSYWLHVEYREPNGNSPSESGYTWKSLCSQSLRDYRTKEQMINRITLMLISKVQSATQDTNGLLEDYEISPKTRKAK